MLKVLEAKVSLLKPKPPGVQYIRGVILLNWQHLESSLLQDSQRVLNQADYDERYIDRIKKVLYHSKRRAIVWAAV